MIHNLINKMKVRSLSSYLVRVSTLVTLISSIIISLLLYNSVETYLQNESIQNAIENTSQAANTVERELTKVNNMLHAISSNETIISELKVQSEQVSEGYAKFQSSNQLKEYLFLLSNESNYIEDIIILTDNNQFSSSNLVLDFKFNELRLDPLINTDYFFSLSDYLTNTRSNTLTTSEITQLEDDYLMDRFFFATNIVDSSSNFHGQLLILINHESLINNLLNSSNYRVTHQNNMTIIQGESFEELNMNPGLNDVYTVSDDNLVFSQQILPFGLNLDYQLGRFTNINLSILLVVILLITLIVTFVSSFLAKHTARSFLRPLFSLLDWINQQKSSPQPLKFPKDFDSKIGFRRRIQIYFLSTILVPIFTIILIIYLLSMRTVSREVIDISRSEHESKTILLDEELNKVQKVLASYSANLNLASDNEGASFGSLVSYIDSDNTLSQMEYLALYGYTGELLISTYHSAPPKIDTYLLRDINDTNRFSTIPVATEQTGALMAIRIPRSMSEEYNSTDQVLVVKLTDDFFYHLPNIEDADFEVITFNDSVIWNLTNTDEPIMTSNNPYIFNTELLIDGMVFSSVYDMTVIINDINHLFLSNAYLLVILVLVIIIISLTLSNRVVRPFTRIMMSFNQSTSNSSHPPFDWQTDIDEIDELQHTFADSIERLNQLTNERVENQKVSLQSEYERRELQLFALQNQVNPHFLYNSLDNLLFLVESGELDRASMMVSSLSHFFRFITNRSHTIIPVQEEIAFTKRYIEIMKVRFDNFEVEWQVNPDVLSSFMMKLTLQPLVENAIQHAAARTDDLVTIKVKIEAQDNRIYLLISDNGSGIAPDKLDYIRSELKHSSYNKSGLFNVRDRLELYYGDSVLDIESQLEVGTSINIIIPQKNSAEDLEV